MLATISNLNAVRVLTCFTQTDSPSFSNTFLWVNVDWIHHYPFLDVERSTIHLHKELNNLNHSQCRFVTMQQTLYKKYEPNIIQICLNSPASLHMREREIRKQIFCSTFWHKEEEKRTRYWIPNSSFWDWDCCWSEYRWGRATKEKNSETFDLRLILTNTVI